MSVSPLQARPVLFGRDYKILVAEDDTGLRETLADILKIKAPAGDQFIVSQAANGKEAARLLGEEKFDAVMTDNQMPGGDGLSLLHFIQTLPEKPRYTVMLSGDDDVRSKALEAGADAFFSKFSIIQAIESFVKAVTS